jgi:sirohydrochlorin ferrochelatase
MEALFSVPLDACRYGFRNIDMVAFRPIDMALPISIYGRHLTGTQAGVERAIPDQSRTL